jgi:nucleoside-diphosphate-sugar epimerase
LRQDTKVALCDVSNPDSYREHIAPGSVLVNCAVAHDGDELDRVVVSGALALLDAAAAKGAHRVVLLSSMLAYGDPPSSGVVDESTATTASQMPYARAKAEMERRCQQWARSHATQVVILQPTCVYGPYAKDFGTAALEEMRSGRFFLHESGQGMANLVYVGNLVDAILLAASRPVASGSRYIVNEDGEVTCWADFYGRLSEAAFGVPITTYPSISLKELEMICARWRRQHQFPNVLREAIRASPAAVDWLVAQGWFKAWRAWRGRGRENDAATTHTPAIDTDSAALPAQDAAAADASARKALHERLLAQRRLFVDESTGRFFSTRSVYSSQRIRSELGWVPRIAREKALAFTETWAADTYAHRPLMRHLP